jgi:hypothetical protein
MPYVYIPSSSYGGNNPSQVGGYTPARRLRTSRGGALTIAQEQERQRQVALAREKHLLEVEKVRADRAALAKKQQEEQAAARSARQPATTQPSQAGAYYGPSSEEQRRAREAGQGYRDSTGKISGAMRRRPNLPETIARPADMPLVAGIDTEGPPASPPTPKTYAPTGLPGITPGVFGPPSGMQALNAYASQARPSAHAPNLAPALSPLFPPPTPAKPRELTDIERLRMNMEARSPEALLRYLIMSNRPPLD